jgi:dTDP-4-amino-4,6-dideoxygalactose transaminase
VIRIAEPRLGDRERQAVLDVLASGRLTSGDYTHRLEAAFARDVSRTAEAVAVSSGTAALHLALLAHDIGPGDEVITTPFSFQATANMILAVGARPVFVDVDANGNLDPSQVEAAITHLTKALLPVHLYGRLCDMPALCDIAASHHLAIIEDAAQAHGATFTKNTPTPNNSASASLAGPGVSPTSEPETTQAHGATFAEQNPASTDAASAPLAGFGVSPNFRVSCFSLYATKNLTAGEGGVVTTNDPAIAERVRRLRSHGEAERYESIEVGYNYRITEVGAALALSQLDSLAEGNQRRRDNAAYLSQHLRGVETPEPPTDPASHVWHQYTVRVAEGRDALQQHLRNHGIEAMVYYPKTLPAQKLYRDLGYDDDAFPMARQLTHEVLSLPVHPGLSQTDVQTIVEAVKHWTTVPTPGKVTTK